MTNSYFCHADAVCRASQHLRVVQRGIGQLVILACDLDLFAHATILSEMQQLIEKVWVLFLSQYYYSYST